MPKCNTQTRTTTTTHRSCSISMDAHHQPAATKSRWQPHQPLPRRRRRLPCDDPMRCPPPNRTRKLRKKRISLTTPSRAPFFFPPWVLGSRLEHTKNENKSAEKKNPHSSQSDFSPCPSGHRHPRLVPLRFPLPPRGVGRREELPEFPNSTRRGG
uniref:Uncharacterized protein n=1 Tax=Arundo donax TaxID=35708 RepID=A0A0A9HJ09_ARUDO